MRRAAGGAERALFWTLAFAAFAAASVAFCACAVEAVAQRYEIQTTGYAIVRVVAPEGPEGIGAAQRALADAPHVATAAPMTAGRAGALLGMSDGGPDLRLIELQLRPESSDSDVAGDIRAALAQAGVTAEIETVGAGPESVAQWVRRLALWAALGFGAVMAAVAALTARALAHRRRELVTVMTDLGATAGQTAGRVGDEGALLGLYAGAAGAFLAAAAALLALLLALPHASFDTLPKMIRPLDLVPLALTPLGAAIAAGFGARAEAVDLYNRAARLG